MGAQIMGAATAHPLSAPRPNCQVALRSDTGVPTAQSASKAVLVNQTMHRAAPIPPPLETAKLGRGVNAPNARDVGPTVRKDLDVPKEELLQFEGLVTEILPDTRYRVQLDNGHELVAYTAGRMKKNRIKTLAGDRVTVEVSPYDLEKGRLIFRHKDERAAGISRPPQRNQFRRR
jgi:translation initiation factor IF-1